MRLEASIAPAPRNVSISSVLPACLAGNILELHGILGGKKEDRVACIRGINGRSMAVPTIEIMEIPGKAPPEREGRYI